MVQGKKRVNVSCKVSSSHVWSVAHVGPTVHVASTTQVGSAFLVGPFCRGGNDKTVWFGPLWLAAFMALCFMDLGPYGSVKSESGKVARARGHG